MVVLRSSRHGSKVAVTRWGVGRSSFSQRTQPGFTLGMRAQRLKQWGAAGSPRSRGWLLGRRSSFTSDAWSTESVVRGLGGGSIFSKLHPRGKNGRFVRKR